MSLKPWREVARPHKDVLEGTFKQSEFAADIAQVANGTAPAEYQDAEKFFSRTFITEGMRLLLLSVAQRLAGQGGDPVIQLQTAFGGGKTHTMLAVYHLASRKVSTSQLEGIPPILDQAGITDLPHAKVAMIDGISLAPSQELVKKDGQKVSTLWGEIAYQLLGEEGLAMIRESHEQGTSPGKALLVDLLTRAAPCVVLMDEMVAFLRQFEPGKSYKAGTFDTNLTFIQALTEAMKAVPNAILLASLPESEVEVGGNNGQRALNSLEKYFARVESVWKPVATEEAFEIVRRRLFEYAGERSLVEGICRQFADFYRNNSSKFPTETQSNIYFERLCHSYPIHPEIFDRLYEDWSTLDKFQRTRGVLQYMAIVIHRLWTTDNRDAMILPGSIALEDSNVRNKSIHYLPQGWEPVLEREVDGPRSEPYSIDKHDTRFGSVQAARRAMRTIFLGSAPSVSTQMVKGIQTERILLGCVQPEQTIGIYEDVLKRLRDRLHYLYADQDRFWLDTRPNLRREMESRKQQVDERQELIPLLRDRARQMFASNHCFAGIHVFTNSADVPDEYGLGLRLVVLEPEFGFSRSDRAKAEEAATGILEKRGEQPRQKRNRLIFLAPDFDVVSRMKDAGRTWLAWNGIVSDIDNGKLNLDLFQAKQARKSRDGAQDDLRRVMREAYKWLLCPVEELFKGKVELEWEAAQLSASAPNLSAEIENKLKEEEWLITDWSPVHLKNVLEQWYFKDGVEAVGALKVFQDCCHYLFMPRLLNDSVFKATLNQALLSRDFFGFAAGKDGDKYLGFVFGKGGMVALDNDSLLIAQPAAERLWQEMNKPVVPVTPTPGSGNGNSGNAATGGSASGSPGGSGGAGGGGAGNGGARNDEGDTGPDGGIPPVGNPKQHFYGSKSLDPLKAKAEFADLYDEIIEQFTARGMNVKISLEIEVTHRTGFDEGLQRTIKENCGVLKFNSAEFEE